MTLAEREKHTKEVVNACRKAAGLRALARLKRGIPGHRRCCTLLESLRDSEGNFIDGNISIDKNIKQFIQDFDAGKYPHLEIPKTPVKIKFPGDRKQTVIE